MTSDCGGAIAELRVDGGPTRNGYLMQFQSDLSGVTVSAASLEELSALGVGYLAGQTVGLYDNDVFRNIQYRCFRSERTQEWQKEKRKIWTDMIRRI